MQRAALLAAGIAALSLPACTTEQVYASGQAWQRSQCAKLLERWEYERCMRDADLAYDEYKRRKAEEEQRAAERKPQ